MNKIVAIHGIKTGRFNWADVLRVYVQKDLRFHNYEFIELYWGRLHPLACIIPFIKLWKIKFIEKKLQEIYDDNTDKLYIIAHSYGTMLSWKALQRLLRKKSNVNVERLILVSGVVRVGTKVQELLDTGILKKLINYYSPNDEVAGYNPFGHAGAHGFKETHEHLFQKLFKVEHSEWFQESPPNFYEKWLDDMANESDPN